MRRRKYAGACGWSKAWLYTGKDTGQILEWQIPANSRLIGFIDEENGLIYLDPVASATIATRQAESQGTPQSFRSVGRELLNEKLCRSHGDKDGTTRATWPTRIPDHGIKRYLWISIADLFEDPQSESLIQQVASEPVGPDCLIEQVTLD